MSSSAASGPADVAVAAAGVGKAYRILHQGGPRRSLAGRFRRMSRETLWALRDVSFEIGRGEVVGVVGRNGAGKSTLLKLLSHITEPTVGQIGIWGRVGSLLEVGTGFHPELTGRENVFLNGSILGMTRAEIRDQYDAIVDFSGVERFMDTPVKRYSSGMRVRLAFAVAVHLKPEILIVDEVLSVGDADFQRRCLAKMDEVARSGRTILLVSHNLGSIQSLCSRALLMEGGRLVMDDSADAVVGSYLARMRQAADSPGSDPQDRPGNGAARVRAVRVASEAGGDVTSVMGGEDVTLEVDYECARPGRPVSASLNLYNQQESAVAAAHTFLTRPHLPPLGRTGTLRCRIRRLPLTNGRYRVALALQVEGETADHLARAAEFDVAASVFYPSGASLDARAAAVLLDHEWEHLPGPPAAAGN